MQPKVASDVWSGGMPVQMCSLPSVQEQRLGLGGGSMRIESGFIFNVK
jgi:hypothetical protein